MFPSTVDIYYLTFVTKDKKHAYMRQSVALEHVITIMLVYQ